VRAPRGFVVVATDHFGPKRWRKTNRRGDYVITWERKAHGALNLPDTTGYRLYKNGREVSAIEPTPEAAWLRRDE